MVQQTNGRPRFTIGAFALIFDADGRLLLSHRRDMDAWNLPGGGVEIGELPTETVVREVREETGLDVVVDHFVGVYGKETKAELVFTFVCRPTDGRLTLTDEADAHKYFAPDELPSNVTPKLAQRLRDALARHPEPCFRRQSGPSTREWLAHLEARQRRGDGAMEEGDLPC